MNEPFRRAADFESNLIVISILAVLVGATIRVQPEAFPTNDQRLVQQILVSLEGRRPNALELASKFMERPASGPFGVALAAEAAAVTFDNEAAVEHFRKLPADGGLWEHLREMGLARRCEVTGRLTEEEKHLRRALELDPYNIEANSRLGHILQISGRSWEAIPQFLMQIRRGKCRGDELLGIAAPERFFRADDHLERMGLALNPPDVLTKLSIARRMIYSNRQAEAELLLKEVIDQAPHLGEAQGRLGRIIFDRGDAAEFLNWRGQLPDDARGHPEVWFVQGLQARRLGQTEGATRCFLETLTLSSNHLAANVQIAGCLDQLNQSAIAKEFVLRAENLATMESLLSLLRANVDPDLIKRVISASDELGRYWEAAGWTYVLSHIDGISTGGTQKNINRWLQLAVATSVQVAPSVQPVTKLRRSDFAEPRWTSSGDSPFSSQRRTGEDAVNPSTRIAWALQDDAQRVGIDFQYFEGTSEENRLQHIFNVVGGGLAAFDFDRDGWCDLHLAQANNWHDPSPQPDYPDRLYRNVHGHFRDVTMLAGTGDIGFTHGVTAGDFDQDGFPDLYLGNLGANRLYQNNGDGTFSDVTVRAGVGGSEWTTSSVFADFNADGLPDLYVANYSVLDETAKKECKRSSGEPMACTPDVLTAEFHRLYLNRGDGTFTDVTSESGMRLPNGRGLALIAWDFLDDGRLGLFVANDTSPNFLFVNTGTTADGIPHFREEGAIRGVAYDADGNAQACMGIAAGDANGDGRIDMYITNFYGESDTLYSQRADGFFEDATRPFALRDAGFWNLGFGCQFLDLDGDGWDDLISTNGHVDQQSSRGEQDRMPPQVFRNLLGKRFAEVPGAELGAFFERKYLGRGLAVLDWNRDGMTDVAISHLHAPFALITNRTTPKETPLVVKLAGRSGAREPVGAVVTVRTRKREIFRLMTAGDGYLSTNERRLAFFVPNEEMENEIQVKWPGGRLQKWDRVKSNQEVLLIEGRDAPVTLRSFRSAEPNIDVSE